MTYNFTIKIDMKENEFLVDIDGQWIQLGTLIDTYRDQHNQFRQDVCDSVPNVIIGQ